MEIPYKVHRGFLKCWKYVEDIIISKITELKEDSDQYRWEKIIIVGYSHGGALCVLCTECVWFYRADLRKDGFKAYAFEAPRVFGAFKVPKELQERWDNLEVYRTGTDLVTHCPPCIFGYCHVGHLIKIDGDPSLVQNNKPKCIKYHYPAVVRDALIRYEQLMEE